MQRSEVWWVDFDPAIGGEMQKTRPAVIVSNNAANAALNRLQVVPLSSNVGKLYPSEAVIVLDGKPSKAMADQLTTVAKERLKRRLGNISHREMIALEGAIKVQLAIR